MPTVAELDVVISADTRQFDVGVKHVEEQAKGLGKTVSEGVGMGLGFGAVSKGLELLGDAFGAAKGAAIDLNSSLEQSKIAFTTMLGSAQKADAFLGDLEHFAAATPFEFPDLVTASKRMFAFGFESKQVIPLLTAVGDAVAAVGGGADVIDGVTTALGQMQAKGKVSAEEMNQLAERGIPAWDMLAKKLGITVAQAMDQAAKGQIKAVTMIEAFQEGAASRFGGMMAKQARTWQGALSTISDTVNMAIARAFRPLFDVMSAGAIMLADFLQTDTFSAWTESVTASLGDVITATVELGRSIATTLQPAFAWVMAHGDEIKAVFLGAASAIGTLLASQAVVPIIAGVGSALMLLLTPIGLVAAAGATLALAWQGNWLNIQGYVQTFLTWLQTVAVPFLLSTLGAAWTYLTTTVVPLFQAALATLQSWLETTLMPTLTSLYTWLSSNVGTVVTWLTTTAWPALGNAMNAVQNWINQTLVPALTSAWSWLSEKMGDALVWLRDKGWPMFGDAMNAVQNWINQTLVPALTGAWHWLWEMMGPALTWLTETGWPLFKDAMFAVWQWISDSLIPKLKEVWDWLKTNFQDALTWLIDYGWPTLQTRMQGVSDTIQNQVVPWFQTLNDELAKRGAYDDMADALWNIYNALSQINIALPGVAGGFRIAFPSVIDFANAIKYLTSAFREWADAAPYDIIDGLNDFAYQLTYGIYRAIKGLAEAAKWIADATGKDLPGWASNPLSPPERPEPVKRPGGSGGGGGGGNSPSPPTQSPEPPPLAAPAPPPAPISAPPPAPPAQAPSTSEPTGAALIAWIDSWGTAHFGVDFGHAAAAIAMSEGAAGDLTKPGAGGARGPFQFDPQGELPAYASALGMSVSAAGNYAGTHPQEAAMWALNGYLGGAINGGLSKGLKGFTLADYGSRYGQRPHGSEIDDRNNPEAYWARAGNWHLKMYGYAGGGWAGLNGPELAWLGERGPEYVIPHDVIASQRPGALQTMRVDLTIGGRLAEQIYIRGRDLALQRARTD